MDAPLTPWLDDGDVRLFLGDAAAVLAKLPAASIHTCVTSPPYWGLRDYGVDGQIGLEDTPDAYVAGLVAVFREVRRVLRPDATLWLNLGDSYAGGGGFAPNAPVNVRRREMIASGENHHGSFAISTSQHHRNRSGGIPTGNGLKAKDLAGIPWRVAFALQADGWYLRSDIIWAKPNPMPESVTDRPTNAHEHVFLLAPSARYWYDADAVREPHALETAPRPSGSREQGWARAHLGSPQRDSNGGVGAHPAGRNLRNVWTIATQPTPEAHFATFPQALVERCLNAGCPEQVCRTCGEARRRVVEAMPDERLPYRTVGTGPQAAAAGRSDGANRPQKVLREDGRGGDLATRRRRDTGWTDCGHGDYRPGVVLDPFVGSGTTALVARRMGRRCVGIDLSADYLTIAARRLSQQSIFTEVMP